MMITRSKNKKIISLVNFDIFDRDQDYFKILAWSIKLRKIDLSDKL